MITLIKIRQSYSQPQSNKKKIFCQQIPWHIEQTKEFFHYGFQFNKMKYRLHRHCRKLKKRTSKLNERNNQKINTKTSKNDNNKIRLKNY